MIGMSDWTYPLSGSDREVECIACGTQLARSDAREYDKYGNRWDREGKQFEYLCKPCYSDLCHFSREGLEAKLVQAGAGERDRTTFLRIFTELDDQEMTTD